MPSRSGRAESSSAPLAEVVGRVAVAAVDVHDLAREAAVRLRADVDQPGGRERQPRLERLEGQHAAVRSHADRRSLTPGQRAPRPPTSARFTRCAECITMPFSQ